MKRLTSLVPTLLLSVALVAQFGCKKKDEGEAAPAGESAAPAEKTGGVAAAAVGLEAETPAILGLEALALVPKDALFVIAGDSLQGLADRLGREQLMSKYGEQLKPAVEAVKAAVGANLLEPAQWKEVGLDATAPVGFAFAMVGEQAVGILFGGLSDAEKAKGLMTKLLEADDKTLASETAGEAQLLHAEEEPEAAVILKGKTLVAVMADDKALDAARALATLAKADSLAENKAFAGELKALGFGKHIAGMLDIGGMFKAFLLIDAAVEYPEPVAVKAPEGDAEAEAMAAEQARIREDIEKARKAAAAETAETNKKIADVIDRLTGGKALASFGFSLEKSAILGKARYTFGENATLAKLVKPGKGTPAIVRTLDKTPLYLFSATLNLDEITKLVRGFAEMEGETQDFEQGVKMVRGLTGIDLDNLGKTFTGEIALGIQGDTKGVSRDELPTRLGGVLLLGLADEKALKDTVDRLMDTFGSKMGDSVKRDGDTITVKTPWKPLHIRIANGYLAASDDPKAFERLAGSGAGFAATLDNEGLKKIITGGSPAAIGLMDIGLIGDLGAGARAYDATEPKREVRAGDSEEIKDKTKEVEAQRAEVEKLRIAKDAEETAFMKELFGAMGLGGGRMDIADDGSLVSWGGIYLRGKTLPELVAMSVDYGVKQETGQGASGQFRDARNKLWELEDELMRME